MPTESENIVQSTGVVSVLDPMSTGPSAETSQQSTSLVIAELAGDLKIPNDPTLTSVHADIYRGFWTSPQGERIEVAVKQFKRLIPPDRQTNLEELQRRAETRIRREASIWSRVTHPNLHPLLGYHSQPKPRLVSPWCRHGNLSDYLIGSRGLSRLEKLQLIWQVACGLEYLHSQTPPICHGDIKPGKVLINDRLEAMLSDFGLSRLLMGLGVHSGFTTSLAPCGTLCYMAGELLNNEGARPTCETDVYAFGGLILAVMSGKPPFYGLHATHIMVRVAKHEQPRPQDYPELPHSDPLWSLMRRCWDKTPAARPAIREVVEKLRGEISVGEGDVPFLSFTMKELEGELHIPAIPEIATHDAEIYRGTWQSPMGQGVEVAVKGFKLALRRSRHDDPEALRKRLTTRLQRELFVWGRAQHPNLHPFLGYRSQPNPILSSPWCRHGNISDYLREVPDLSRLQKLLLIWQVARGLDHLHSQSPPIPHGNITPLKVLINDRREAVLLRFSSSQVLMEIGAHTGLTTNIKPDGTLPYMAREFFKDGWLGPNCETDVHAFGGLILAVMSGKPPFYDLPQSHILRRIIVNQQPIPEDHPKLPPSDPLWNLMRKCWDANPQSRPTIRGVLSELWEELSRGGLDLPRPDPVPVPNNRSAGDSGMDLDASAAAPTIASDQDVNSSPEGEFSATWKVFKTLEMESKGVPVVGKYIGDAAEIGLTLLDIVRTISTHRDEAESLGSKTNELADLLEGLKKLSESRRGDDAGLRITDTQKELQSVRVQLRKWDKSGVFGEAFAASGDTAERQAKEETVRQVMEQIQLLGSSTPDLIAELEDTWC